MQALVIDDHTRVLIKDLIQRASENVVPLEQVMRAAEYRAKDEVNNAINELNDGFSIKLPVDIMVTYTHEEQKQCVCRHISVSIGKSDKAIHPVAMNFILDEFGFKNRLGHLPIWVSQTPENLIIEAIEPLDGDVLRLAVKG